MWGRVGEGVVAIVRRLSKGWVDRGIRQRRGELTYRLCGDDSYSECRMMSVDWLSG